jgi:glycosyltransferase involved in cell wall biosynthesis
VDAQAARAIQLLTDERLHRRIAATARQTAVSRFSTDSIIPLYERYYEQICGASLTTSP